jgi:putative ABC transport system ATP-binding protein
MTKWADYFPSELSSGQQQRVAVARALIIDPELIIADEPTGNLDYVSGQELMVFLNKLNNQGKTVIMVTHDLEYLKFAKRAINILDGQVEKIYQEKDLKELAEGVRSKKGAVEKAKI